MNPAVPDKIYRFADFSISRAQQILLKGSERIPISTKLYHLLLALVENAGRVLSKDELIDAAWPGQIVTDGTLSRAVTRLRQLIGDRDVSNPIIETHRGMGYRFALPVQVEERDPAPEQENRQEKPLTPPVARRAGWIVGALLLMAVSAYYLQKKNTDHPGQAQASMAVNLAVFATPQQQDWLNQGGKAFLVDELRKHPLIHAVLPQTEGNGEDDPELLAIRLSADSGIDYSCLISLEKLPDAYNARLKLRDENGVLASTEIQAKDLTELLQASSRWISTKLDVHDKLTQAVFVNSGSSDEYALRSYFQGIYEIETGGDLKRARDFFEAAVNKDPEFRHAWSRLATTLLDLGLFDKAIAIANTQLAQNREIEPILRIRFNKILADAWYRLRDEGKAQQALARAIKAINETDDPFVRLEGLDALIFQSGLKKEYEASEKYTRQAIEISKHYLPLPNKLASLYKKLGITQRLQRKLVSAMSNLHKAIELYIKSGNNNGLISSYCQMNIIRNSLDRIDEIVQSSILTKTLLENSDDLYSKACLMQFTGVALNLRGHFALSDEYSIALKKMASETSNEFFMLLSGALRMHRYYVQNQMKKSAEEIEKLAALLKNQATLPSVRMAFSSLDILVSSRVDPVEIAQKKIDDYLEHHPEAMEDPPTALNISRALGHIAVRSGRVKEGLELLREAEKGHREIIEISVANYIGMEILEILLAHPELEYKDTLARLDKEIGYYYLFYKLKAGFLAREGDYRQAALLMEENKLKANELWTEKDQLLLEGYRQSIQPEHEVSQMD